MRGHTFIQNQVAYDLAVKRNIVANAQKTWRKNNPDTCDAIEAFLMAGRTESDRGVEYTDNFVGSLASAFDNYGKLSPKQCEAVVRSIAQRQERREAMNKAIEEQKAASQHIGGEKLENVRVTVDKVLIVKATQFSYYDAAWQYVYLMRDDAGNRIVYKTKNELGFKFKHSKKDRFMMDDLAVMRGMTMWINASIKAHAEYKGEKQTIIIRAKVLGMEYDIEKLKDPVDLTN